MRENRPYGSEGGVAKAIPTPIHDDRPQGATSDRGTKECGAVQGETEAGSATGTRGQHCQLRRRAPHAKRDELAPVLRGWTGYLPRWPR